ncbi:hypothetical protein VTK26DRAFT_5963 [Humicola hyalothermophila]
MVNKPLPAPPDLKEAGGHLEGMHVCRTVATRDDEPLGQGQARQQGRAENASEPSPLATEKSVDKARGPRPPVPVRWKPSQVRNAVTFPATMSRMPAIRPLPGAASENQDSVPDRQESPCGTPVVQASDDDKPQTVENSAKSIWPAAIKLGIVSKPDLHEMGKFTASPPSSPVEVVDSIVHKLRSTDKRRTCPGFDRPRHRGRGGTNMSPVQRLQRVAALRRQRIMEETIQVSVDTEQQHCTQSDLTSAPTSRPQGDGSSGINGRDEGPGVPTAAENEEKQQQQQQQQLEAAEDDSDISDRDVLRGLRIVCAACADAEFDAMVRNKTGLRLRRFLADLQSFEELRGGDEGQRDV